MIDRRQAARQVARWIDSLPVDGVERDAIIQHPDPTFKGDTYWNPSRDCGCLVGCVVDALRRGDPQGHPYRFLPVYWEPWFDDGTQKAADTAAIAFPYLTALYGPERVWAWVKARAARPYRTSATKWSQVRISQQAHEPVMGD